MLLLLTKLILWYAAMAHLGPERMSQNLRSLEVEIIESSLQPREIHASRDINCRIIKANAAVEETATQIAESIHRHTPHPQEGESWWIYAEAVDQMWSPDPCADNDYAFQRHTIETAGARILIESAEHTGILDELISISKASVVVPQECDSAPLDAHGNSIHGFSSLRRSAYLLSAAAFLAHQSGDDLRCAELLAASIRLGRLADSTGLNVERLIAISILNNAMDRIAQLISLRPLTPEALELLATEMSTPPFTRTWTDITTLSTRTISAQAASYYTERRRGGILAWHFIENRSFGPDISTSVLGENHSYPSASTCNALALLLPRRDWYERRMHEYSTLLGPWLDLPPLQRRAPHAIDGFFASLERGLPYLPENHSAHARMGREYDALLCRYHGTRILLAIEDFRAVHERLPPTLDDLVPVHLAEIPQDPFAPDTRYRYRALASGTDPHHGSYLLYSVGLDAIDNDGFLEETYLNNDMLKSDRFGNGDHIINLPANPKQ